ncbi:MAG: hypothetical protein JRH20_29160, partial [Deltaproteobacteria bacterium]|nr:hypothetical protein [Deltaproteobacteria bacterium]
MNDYRSNDWKRCAKEGIRAQVIERCARSSQGRRLLARDMKHAVVLQISGSPTWLANNRFKFSGISAERIKKSFCEHNPKTP